MMDISHLNPMHMHFYILFHSNNIKWKMFAQYNNPINLSISIMIDKCLLDYKKANKIFC